MPLIRLQQAGARRGPRKGGVLSWRKCSKRAGQMKGCQYPAGQAGMQAGLLPLAAPVEDALLGRGGGVVDALEHVLQSVKPGSCCCLRWLEQQMRSRCAGVRLQPHMQRAHAASHPLPSLPCTAGASLCVLACP